MKILKDIDDIEFNPVDVYGEEVEVSEPIVMASNAGWYVGRVSKNPEIGDWFVEPFSRETDYFATLEEAQKLLEDQ